MEDQNQTQINNGKEMDELETCKKQAEEYLNNWRRERADFVNYKKDEAKRMEEFVGFANEALILELLDLMDDLYAAAKQVKDDGLDQTVKKFEDWLKKYEVEKIKVEGEKFDPLRHDAVTTETQKGPEAQNGVSGMEDGGEKLEEVRAGYTIHDRVIRPARVKIIK